MLKKKQTIKKGKGKISYTLKIGLQKGIKIFTEFLKSNGISQLLFKITRSAIELHTFRE